MWAIFIKENWVAFSKPSKQPLNYCSVFPYKKICPSPLNFNIFVSVITNYFNFHCLPTVLMTFWKPKEVFNLSPHCIPMKISFNLLFNRFSFADIFMQGINCVGSWTRLFKAAIIILTSEWYRWILGIKNISSIIAQQTQRNTKKAFGNISLPSENPLVCLNSVWFYIRGLWLQASEVNHKM